jgi:hypothetical protein
LGVDRRALGYRNKIYQVAKSSRRSLRRAVALHRPDWRDGWTAAVSAFQAFEVPLVELPRVDDADSESIGRVCAIFEKLNSTGVDLSVYDLLTARRRILRTQLHQSRVRSKCRLNRGKST